MNKEHLKTAAESRLIKLKQEFSATEDQRRQRDSGLERMVRSYWDEPLLLLEMQIESASEAGRELNSRVHGDGSHPNCYAFQVLVTLHARACQVSREVLVLLRNGYSDGASARWRTLHEIVVVANVIRDYGDDVARKYQLHYVMQAYKSMRQFRRLKEQLGEELTKDDVFDDLESFRFQVVKQEGSSFKKDYGWAASVTKPQPPTMYHLEKLTDNNYLRYFYKMASDSVHVNALGDYNRAMQIDPETTVLVDGPRISGLADPGKLTASSLTEVTKLLLETWLDGDREVTIAAIKKLADEIDVAFQAAHQHLEALENDIIV